HEVHIIREVLPGARDPFHLSLAAEFPFGAYFTGHAGHFRGKRAELVHHRIDGVLELEDFAFDVDGDCLGELGVGHGGGHFGDVAHLGREVAGHEIDAVGQVLPGAGHALDLCLPAQLAFRADLAGHARYFGGEGAELVHHRIDGVFQLEDFAFDVDGDFLGEVAIGHSSGYVGDVAHLAGEVAGHEIDTVRQ